MIDNIRRPNENYRIKINIPVNHSIESVKRSLLDRAKEMVASKKNDLDKVCDEAREKKGVTNDELAYFVAEIEKMKKAVDNFLIIFEKGLEAPPGVKKINNTTFTRFEKAKEAFNDGFKQIEKKEVKTIGLHQVEVVPPETVLAKSEIDSVAVLDSGLKLKPENKTAAEKIKSTPKIAWERAIDTGAKDENRDGKKRIVVLSLKSTLEELSPVTPEDNKRVAGFKKGITELERDSLKNINIFNDRVWSLKRAMEKFKVTHGLNSVVSSDEEVVPELENKKDDAKKEEILSPEEEELKELKSVIEELCSNIGRLDILLRGEDAMEELSDDMEKVVSLQSESQDSQDVKAIQENIKHMEQIKKKIEDEINAKEQKKRDDEAALEVLPPSVAVEPDEIVEPENDDESLGASARNDLLSLTIMDKRNSPQSMKRHILDKKNDIINALKDELREMPMKKKVHTKKQRDFLESLTKMSKTFLKGLLDGNFNEKRSLEEDHREAIRSGLVDFNRDISIIRNQIDEFAESIGVKVAVAHAEKGEEPEKADSAKEAETVEEPIVDAKVESEQERIERERKEQEFGFSRAVSDITKYRFENKVFENDTERTWAEFDGLDEGEREKKFQSISKEVWDKLVVHRVGKDESSKFTDLDGKASLGLLKIAGFSTKDVEYVKQGDHRAGKINMDTGHKHGLVVLSDGTVFIDHHGLESKNDSSAAKFVFEVLKNQGKIKETDREHLERLVDFVTQMDNRNFPYGSEEEEKERYLHSDQTMIGLQRFVQFEKLLLFFKDGKKGPKDVLTEDELKRYGFIFAQPVDKKTGNEQVKAAADALGIDFDVRYKTGGLKKEDKEKLKEAGYIHDSKKGWLRMINRSIEQKNAIERSLATIKDIEENDKAVLESEKYGKILISLDKAIPNSSEATKAMGYGAYVVWAPEKNSYLVTTKAPLENFSLSQGVRVRETMWLLKGDLDDTKPSVKLNDILSQLMPEGFDAQGKLKECLEKEASEAERPLSPVATVETPADLEKEAKEIETAEEVKTVPVPEQSTVGVPDTKTEELSAVDEAAGVLATEAALATLIEENEPSIPAEEIPKPKTSEEIFQSLGFSIGEEDFAKEFDIQEVDGLTKLGTDSQEQIRTVIEAYRLKDVDASKVLQNIEKTFNEAIESEAERSFKHSKKLLAAGIGVGALAAAATTAMRLKGGGLIMKIAGGVSGTILGGISGAIRNKVREWLDPALANIKKDSAKSFEELKKKKAFEMSRMGTLKTIAIQAIRQEVLSKLSTKTDKEEADPENAKRIIAENLKNYTDLSEAEAKELANSLFVLKTISQSNEEYFNKVLTEKTKGMKSTAKSAAIGALIGGAADLARFGNIPYLKEIASGAVSGIFFGQVIDSWQKKKRFNREVTVDLARVKNIQENFDNDVEITKEEKVFLQSLLQEGILKGHQADKNGVAILLSDIVMKSMSETNSKKIEELLISGEEKAAFQNKYKNDKRDKAFTAASYVAGAAAGWAMGALGNQFVEAYNEKTGGINPVTPGANQELSPEARHQLEILGKGTQVSGSSHPTLETVKALESERVVIGGKTSTMSHAAYEAIKRAPVELQDKYIHNYATLKNIEITSENRAELLSKATRQYSISNIDSNPHNNIKDLIHKGDKVYINSEGRVVLEETSGQKAGYLHGTRNRVESINPLSEEEIKQFEGLKSNSNVRQETAADIAQSNKTPENLNLNPLEKGSQAINSYVHERLSDQGRNFDGDSSANSATSPEILKKMHISNEDGLTADTQKKLDFLIKSMDREAFAEKYDTIFGSNPPKIELGDLEQYYEQIKSFQGQPRAIEGVVEFLNAGRDPDSIFSSLKKFFNPADVEGLTKDKHFHLDRLSDGKIICTLDLPGKGSLIISNDGGELKIGGHKAWSPFYWNNEGSMTLDSEPKSVFNKGSHGKLLEWMRVKP